MPPETTYCHPPLTPQTPLLSRVDPKSRLKRILHRNRRMKITRNKIIPALVFVLSSASIFRFLNLGIFASFSVSPPSIASPLIRHRNVSSSQVRSTLTEKETRFISNLLLPNILPCNILVFENADQIDYSRIENMNTGGANEQSTSPQDHVQHAGITSLHAPQGCKSES